MEIWVRAGLASRNWAKGKEIEIIVFKAAGYSLEDDPLEVSG